MKNWILDHDSKLILEEMLEESNSQFTPTTSMWKGVLRMPSGIVDGKTVTEDTTYLCDLLHELRIQNW